MCNLDSFGPDFWNIQEDDLEGSSLKHSGGQPISVEQALWEIDIDTWTDMVGKLFPDYHSQDIGIDDIVTLIRETNTCSNLDSPVEVWIDEDGDYRIKVYDS